MRRIRIAFIFICITLLFQNWHPFSYQMTLKKKKLKGPVKMVIERGMNFYNECITVQDFNKKGQLAEIRYFYNQQIFDSTITKLNFETVNKTILDSSLFLIPKYPNYYGLDTNMMEYSHKISFSYLKNGKIASEVGRQTNNEIYFKRLYSYNSLDSLIQEQGFYLDSLNSLSLHYLTTISYEITDSSSTTKTTTNNILAKSLPEILTETTFYNQKHPVKKISHYDYHTGERCYLTVLTYHGDTLISNITQIESDKTADNELIIFEIKINNKLYEVKRTTIENNKIAKTESADWIFKNKKLTTVINRIKSDFDSKEKIFFTHYDQFENETLLISVNQDTIFTNYRYDNFNNWIHRSTVSKNKTRNTSRLIYYYD